MFLTPSLKPLGAQIELFETGNGALKLKDVEIELKESRGGHYTLKVSDLAKLCGEASNSQNVMFGENTKTFQCEVCRNIFDSLDDLKTRITRKHTLKSEVSKENSIYMEGRSTKSSMKRMKSSPEKIKKEEIIKDIVGENSLSKVTMEVSMKRIFPVTCVINCSVI